MCPADWARTPAELCQRFAQSWEAGANIDNCCGEFRMAIHGILSYALRQNELGRRESRER